MRRLLVLGLLGLAACSGKKEKTPDPPKKDLQATGRVEGQLTPFQGAGQQSVRAPFSMPASQGGPSVHELSRLLSRIQPRLHAQGSGPVAPAFEEENAIPGDVIVRFQEPNLTPEQVLQRVKLPGYHAVHKGYASQYLHLVGFEKQDRFAPGAMTVAETAQLVTQLASLPGVRFAELNRRVHPFAVPDDKGFAFQWNYPALNLPAAWNVQQGNPSVVVAVLDTGIVQHPDLSPRVLPGIDMISDPANAGDGDGRDDDPTDTGGDEPQGGSSWHGTHVAGTIGAVTNNGIGVAGVTWAAQILPVRVLGQMGGSSFDIAAGVTWASGGTVPGVRANTTPAKVINLSLGGEGGPQQVYQDVIDAAISASRTVFVVAAGNDNTDAANSTPCDQDNVICVGATSLVGVRSSFSNFGAPVDVMAPGGEMRQDLNGDGFPDGVLSTVLDEHLQPAYIFYEGTSMATPHVSGVVALMAAVRPDIEPAEAERILKATAVPSSQCSEGCGTGLVNAQAALLALNGGPGSAPPALGVNTTNLFFNGEGTLPLLVYNLGGGDLAVTASVGGPQAGGVSFPGGASLSVPALSARPLPIHVSTAGLQPGDYAVPLTVSGAGGSTTVTLKLRVGAVAALDAVVVFVYQDANGDWQTSPELTTVARAADSYRYAIDLTPRTYFVAAAIDDNQNGQYFEEGERVGFWRNTDSIEPIEVSEGQTITGIDFALVPFTSVGASP